MPDKNKLDISLLHVEDQKITRDHIKFLLAPNVSEYYSAKDGLEGYEIFKEKNPDVVITDIRMPGVDGIEMSRKIKECNPKTQIIILSSLEKEDYLLEAINIGIDQFVLKDIGNNHEIMLALERCARQQLLQRELEQQYGKIQRLSQAMDQSSSMIVVFDTDGVITYVNNKFIEFTGLPQDNIIGQPIFRFKGDGFDKLWDELKRARSVKGEYLHLRNSRTEKTCWVQSNITAFFFNKQTANEFIEVIDDITERKKYEEEITKAKEAAQSANKAKSSFLANMSHELRTPLNGVIGMASLLMNTKLDSKQTEYVSLLKNASEALLKIINDILDISKIEAGRFDLEALTFDLFATVKAACDFYVISAQAKNISFSVDIDPRIPQVVVGDKGRLNQILTNLLGNALKFTDLGKIDISAKLIELKDETAKIQFSVSDTGIGISEDKLDSLFERFTQADSSFTRKKGGSGLGLAIAKEIVNLMGGDIWVESKLGFGSKFSFVIPLKVSKESYNENKDLLSISGYKYSLSQPELIKTLKILLAEDNLINQRLIIEVLNQNQHGIKAVFNGQEALNAYMQEKFDLILMDIEMPIMDGLDASMQIREYEKQNNLPKTPIIAITAHTGVEAQQRCFVSGMDSFIKKPINFDAMLATIENLLKKHNPDETFRRPPIDLSILVEGLGGNEIVIKQILKEAMVLMPQDVQELTTAINSGNAQKGKFFSHKLKSALGNLGAVKAQAGANKIENSCSKNDIAEANEILFDFEQEMENIISYLNKFLSNSGA